MNVIQTSINGVVIIEPRVFEDSRGYFFESIRQNEFEEKVAPILFVQENESCSSKYVVGVLSGLTVIVPAVIWYSDGKDNERRDNTLAKHEDSLTWHDAEISTKANSDQGFYDI